MDDIGKVENSQNKSLLLFAIIVPLFLAVLVVVVLRGGAVSSDNTDLPSTKQKLEALLGKLVSESPDFLSYSLSKVDQRSYKAYIKTAISVPNTAPGRSYEENLAITSAWEKRMCTKDIESFIFNNNLMVISLVQVSVIGAEHSWAICTIY